MAGEPVRRAECLQGWRPNRNGHPTGRGASVLFSDGERLVFGNSNVVRLKPSSRPIRLPPIAEVELAGCTRPISNRLYAKLIDGTRPRAEATTFEGAAALHMHILTLRTRMDVYVDPNTLRPLGMRVEANGVVGWSRLRAVTLTTAIQQRFLRRFSG